MAYQRATDRDGPRAGRELVAPPISGLTGYVWPLARGRITLPFKAIPGGSRIKDGKLFHDGLDIASFCGDRVRAAHAGTCPGGGPAIRRLRRLDRRPGSVLPASRQEEDVERPPDRRRHRRRQRLPEHLRPPQQGLRARRRRRPGRARGSASRVAPGMRPAATSTTGCSARWRRTRSASAPTSSSGSGCRPRRSPESTRSSCCRTATPRSRPVAIRRPRPPRPRQPRSVARALRAELGRRARTPPIRR